MKNNPVPAIEQTYKSIKTILEKARSKAFKSVNTLMVQAYWHIGKVIVEEEQKGAERAEYGKGLIQGLADRLSSEFGKGFDERNFWFMRSFYLAYPKVNALRSELSWTHYRLLLRVQIIAEMWGEGSKAKVSS